MDTEYYCTHQKARQINLDSTRHGTFAEIGAGQEVARWFFHVGGASSTVAKTISAYDMAVSDDLYGPTDHYVSRQRLQAMLEREYRLLLNQLEQKRAEKRTFFVFADTVATRSRTRHQEGHGWLGLRFQHVPEATPSEVIIHARMLDREYVREQQAFGALGVNLIFGGFYHHGNPVELIRSLIDDLTPERVEIDMIKLSGPCFSDVDNRMMTLQLVEQGFTDAAMFTADGEVVQPAEVLYQKPILIERGSFRPITHTTVDILECATAQFQAQLAESGKSPVVVMEMSLRNLLEAEIMDHADFLARVDLLGVLGKTVMISNYSAYYQLAEYLHRYTRERVVFALGLPNLRDILEEKYYADLEGGLVEALGRLFKSGVKLFIYPFKNPGTGQIVTAGDLALPQSVRHLYSHFVETGLIEAIKNVDLRRLDVLPGEVLAKMRRGDASWEMMVPTESARMIKDRKFFGYRPSPELRGGDAS